MKKYTNLEQSPKYTSAAEIYTRLLSRYARQCQRFGINELQIARWCGDMVLEIFTDPVKIYNETLEIEVIESKALLPPNVFNVNGCYANKSKSSLINKCTTNGAYVFVPSTIKKCYVDVDLVPIDSDTGFPVLKRRYVEAMTLSCAVKMFEEDAAYGKVDRSFYADLVQRSEHAIEAACVQFDDEELNEATLLEYHRIQTNMITNPLAYLKDKR